MKPLLFTILLAVTINVQAQYRIERYDTSYYISYRNKLTLGIIGLKKNTVFKTDVAGNPNALRFASNSPGRLGISAGHDFLNVSGTIGVAALDPTYSSNKGKTKQLNLQMNVTAVKILADIFFQQYKGFYFTGGESGITPVGNNYYTRPDIKTSLYGATVNIIRNSKKFSAQASFLMDAWQKKSAGSLLYGGEVYYGLAKGDSAFVPSIFTSQSSNSEVSKIDFITFGPGIGYGYTLVMNKHFFITGIASFNADASYINQWDEIGSRRSFWKFNPNLKAKGAIGYNSEKWGINVTYYSNRLFFKGVDEDSRYLNYNDNYRLNYVRRINAGKTIPQITNFGRKIINAVGFGFLIN